MSQKTTRIYWTHPETDEDFVVEATVSGSYSPGGFHSPPEYPEVDLLRVIEDRPGGEDREDVLQYLLEHDRDRGRLEESVLDHALLYAPEYHDEEG
jgi:hypothetical protein